MFLADQWLDYEVLDCGGGEKLERWGDVYLRRPDPQAIWPVRDPSLWRKAQAHYHRSDKGGGSWEGYLRLALLLPLAIVFFLPRMHERYFYLADILSAVLAAKDKKAAPICALVALASLGSYWETALPLSFCALMMFAALILTLRHTQREENVI